jgi:hypothetical protein
MVLLLKHLNQRRALRILLAPKPRLRDQSPATLKKNQVNLTKTYLNDLSKLMLLSRASAKKHVSSFIIDKVVIFKFRNMQKTFEHKVLKFKKEPEGLNFCDNCMVVVVWVLLKIFMQKAQSF